MNFGLACNVWLAKGQSEFKKKAGVCRGTWGHQKTLDFEQCGKQGLSYDIFMTSGS